MKIKALHLISGFSIGGAERNLLNIVRNRDSNKIEHSIAYKWDKTSLSNDFKNLRIPLYKLHAGRFNKLDIRRLLEITELAKIIKNNNYNILHAHMPFSIITGALACKLSGIKCIASMHAMKQQLTPFEFYQARVINPLVSFFIEGATGVCHDLEASGIQSNKIKYIPYGVDGEKFININKEEVAIRFRQRFNIPLEAFLVTRLSRAHFSKGFDLLLDAAPELIRKIPNIHFVLIGDGPEMPTIKQKIKELSLEKHTTLTGYFLNTEEALAATNVFAITAREEALGIATLEALASGCPIVAFNIGSLHDAVINKSNGILVPPRDINKFINAIEMLFNSERSQHKMGAKSREIFYNKFSIQSMNREIGKAYMEATS